MKKLFTLIVLAITVCTLPAEARTIRKCQNTKLLLNEVALNGAAGTRTFEVAKLGGWDVLRLDVQFTHNNNGALTVTCTGLSARAADNSTVNQVDTQRSVCSFSGAACTLALSTTWATASLSADTDYTFSIDVSADEELNCVIAHGGSADADDKVTITGMKCVAGE